MRVKWLLGTTVVAAGVALAAGSAQAVDLTIVSWGGAYTASQQKAYHDPYVAANPDVTIISDDNASEGLSKLRAQVESGNVTWDIVDMVASDAITACDEGLIMEIDPDAWLAPAPDGTPASEDFFAGTLSPGGTNCFIPQIVYSTTFGYRTDVFEGEQPSTIADVFDMEKFPGKRSLERKPINNLEWALLADGVAPADVYPTLSTSEGVDRALAKLDTVKEHVVWWTKGAQPPQLLADGEVVMASAYNGRLFSAIAEKSQPIAMMWDRQVFDLDGWVVPDGRRGPGGSEEVSLLRHRHAASGGPGEVHFLRTRPLLLGTPGGQSCRSRHRHEAAHADGPEQRRDHLRLRLCLVG